MPFPSLLICKSRIDSAATDQGAVYVLEGGVSPRQIGASFGASTVETGVGTQHPVCRAIKFNGKLYAWTRNVIREYDPATGLWTVAYTIADHLTTEQHAYHSGLYFAIVNGLPSIFGAYQNTTPQVRVVLFNGTTWTVSSSGLACSGMGHFGPGFMYRGKLCLPTSENGPQKHLMIDPATGSMAPFTSDVTDSNSRSGGCYVVFGDRLLGCFPITLGIRTHYLYEFFGSGQFMRLQTIAAAGSGSSLEQEWGLFAWSTPTTMYVMFLYHAVAGTPTFRLHKFVATGGAGTAFTATDISTPVLPASLRGNVGINHWIDGFVDNTIPTAPKVYIRLLSNPVQASANGRGSSVYEFVDESTEMIIHGPGPTTAICWPHSNLGGGEYIWDDTTELQQLDVVIEGLTAISGGARVSFRCRNGTGVTSRTIKLFYSETDIPDMSPCTLVAGTVTAGASNTTSEITSVNDDGTILYQVDWASDADGASDAAKLAMVGTIE